MSHQHEHLIRDGELDLFEISRLFWKKRKAILGGGLLGALIGLSHLWISVPVYQARAIVGPPSSTGLAALNKGRGGADGLELLDVSKVFDLYMGVLGSEALRRHFFDSVYAPALKIKSANYSGEGYAKFSRALRVVPPSGRRGGRAAVLLEDSDPGRAVDWLERYINMAATQIRDDLINELEEEASLKADIIERSIRGERIAAKHQREDKIARLYDALTIARALALEGFPSSAEKVFGQGLAMEGLPYLRGVQALEAEIKAMESRTSDDPYIDGLRQQQAKMEFYRRLKIEFLADDVYQWDGVAHIVDWPSGPRSKVVVILGFTLGLLMSMLLVSFLACSRGAVQLSKCPGRRC
ncbi:Wzz/FepE/Etk N-terminal domain-containing protein [Pseudomonas bharatica]|uniref:Wzz/FepE/Etk N-terminal domain-containing protein n=1 Tax=Pseudomonas bharatica TaxID=2692112 RepID=UPI003B27EC04